VAKAGGNPTQEEFSRMLRPLLTDRFRLSVHTETKERAIYALTLARRNGSLGAGLRASALDCSGQPETRPAGCEMLSVPARSKPAARPWLH
jgi:uncharacterized protein (TIGR03435 family)